MRSGARAEAAARAATDELAIPAATIGEAIGYAIGQPDTADVHELVIRPTAQS
jgi:NADP-dependent 3-hydroxy acid dehydrogenase YdfG